MNPPAETDPDQAKDDQPAEEHHEPLSPESSSLLALLHAIRRIKTRYQRLLQCPVPHELERDILAKSPEERLPWEVEALEKIDQWREDVKKIRAHVQKELNDHLNAEFFRGA